VSDQLSLSRRMLAVLCGGFCGTIARYVLSWLMQGWLGKEWPYDILFINLTGALLLAFITVLAESAFLIGPTRRLFINVGFFGAYTTFSSLALGDVLLFAHGQSFLALLYLFASMAGGVLAVWLGDWLGSWCVKCFKPLSWKAAPIEEQTGAKTAQATDNIAGDEYLDERDNAMTR